MSSTQLEKKLPDKWSAIAFRRRLAPGRVGMRWRPASDAPMTLDDAHAELEKGLVEMMSKHEADRVTVMIRPTRKRLLRERNLHSGN